MAKRMRKIQNDAEFARLWRSGMSPQKIARIYGVTRPAVNRAAARFGLGKRGPEQPEKIIPETLDLGPMTIEAELAFTGGRYKFLGEIAEREGMTAQQVIIAYHRARLNKS